MKAINKTKNFTITDDIQFLSSFSEKTKGLLGDKNPHPVFFETRWGIHTFGMLFPIDVLVLDDNNCVQEIKKNLPSNKFFFWNPKYKKIFELPCGLLRETSFSDMIEIS